MSDIINQVIGAVESTSRGFFHRCQRIARLSRSSQRRLITETIDLSKASEEFVSNFAKKLYVVHNRIFAGLDEEAFIRYVFYSGAEQTKIRIYRRSDGEIVGYAAVHRYRKNISEKSITIFRAETGLLPACRAHGRTFYFYTVELL